jgi:hypothetical protein
MKGPEERPSLQPHANIAASMVQLHEELGIEDPGWNTWL